MEMKEALKKGKFVVTAEVSPPKGTDIVEFLEKAERLKGYIDAINVTDQQSAVMRLGSLGGCVLLKQAGIEPVLQVTCRDRNAIALQSDLLNASVLNIDNVLCLTGDHVRKGDHINSASVYELDAVTLLQTVKKLEAGQDLSGNALHGKPTFFAGASLLPEAEIPELEMLRIEKKIQAGADFFQTQCIFDAARARFVLEKVLDYKKPVIAGIVLLKSAAMAKYLNDNIPGVFVPEEIIREIAGAENARKKGLEIAVRIIKQLRNYCNGIHIMSMGQEEDIPYILEQAQILS